jgi:hypothetical protein
MKFIPEIPEFIPRILTMTYLMKFIPEIPEFIPRILTNSQDSGDELWNLWNKFH